MRNGAGAAGGRLRDAPFLCAAAWSDDGEPTRLSAVTMAEVRMAQEYLFQQPAETGRLLRIQRTLVSSESFTDAL